MSATAKRPVRAAAPPLALKRAGRLAHLAKSGPGRMRPSVAADPATAPRPAPRPWPPARRAPRPATGVRRPWPRRLRLGAGRA